MPGAIGTGVSAGGSFRIFPDGAGSQGFLLQAGALTIFDVAGAVTRESSASTTAARFAVYHGDANGTRPRFVLVTCAFGVTDAAGAIGTMVLRVGNNRPVAGRCAGALNQQYGRPGRREALGLMVDGA